MQRKRLQLLHAAVLGFALLSLTIVLSSCYLFVGNPTDIVPLPNTVVVLELPQILSSSATMIRTNCADNFERICGWYYWTEPNVQTPSTGWIYDCHNVRRSTDCLYDIAIRVVVSDPSNDLTPSKSPRLRVFDSEPVSGSGSGANCLLTIPLTDIEIHPADVSGSALTKTVSVRLKDVLARFTDDCHAFSASLRFAIVFEADNEELSSVNTSQASVECSWPYATPVYYYSSPPNMIGPFGQRPVSP